MGQISISELQAMSDKMTAIDFLASATVEDVPASQHQDRASLFDTWTTSASSLLTAVQQAVLANRKQLVLGTRDASGNVVPFDLGLEISNTHAIAMQAWLRLKLGSDDIVVEQPFDTKNNRWRCNAFTIRPPKKMTRVATNNVTVVPSTDRPTVEQLAS